MGPMTAPDGANRWPALFTSSQPVKSRRWVPDVTAMVAGSTLSATDKAGAAGCFSSRVTGAVGKWGLVEPERAE